MEAWQLVSEDTDIVQEIHEKEKDSGRPEMDTNCFSIHVHATYDTQSQQGIGMDISRPNVAHDTYTNFISYLY